MRPETVAGLHDLVRAFAKTENFSENAKIFRKIRRKFSQSTKTSGNRSN